MSSAQTRETAFERAVKTALITLGVAGISSFLTSEGVAILAWPALGIALVGVGVSELPHRWVESLARNPVARLFGAYSIGFPGLTALVLAVVPAAVVLLSNAGISFPATFAVVAVVTALASIANLVVLVLNIDLLRSRGRAQ